MESHSQCYINNTPCYSKDLLLPGRSSENTRTTTRKSTSAPMSSPGLIPRLFFALAILLAFCTSSGDAGRPPRILENPADSVVPRNEPVTLNCRADGDPSPDITWIKDGKPIRGDQRGLRSVLPSGSLFFLRVRKDQDSGVYACVATNTFGEVTSRNATLDVATLRDEFRASPQNTWVAQGDTAVLECEPPRGNPEPKVSWKKNGNPIDVKANGRYRIVGQGSLSISQVRQTDEGRYVCHAKNIVTTRQSNTALLRVIVRPQFTIRPANTSVLLGSDVSFSCVARGDPPPEITWKKQGGALPLKRVHFDEERFLISNVSEQDSGVFVCVADNKAGSISSSATVTVLPLPKFTVVPQNVEIQPNSTAYFGCEGAGDPKPTLFWSKEGGHSVIFEGSGIDNIHVTPEGTLQIDNVSERDEGYYFCAAVSLAGSAIQRVHLKVTPVEDLPPPIINVGPSNQTRPVGSVAVMPCIADGNPPPVITWYKNGNSFLINHRVFTDDAGTLRINELIKDDSGLYECVASSRSGKYVWKAHLNVENPSNPTIKIRRNGFDLLGAGSRPREPMQPQIVKVDSSSITIAWNPLYFTTLEESSSSNNQETLKALDFPGNQRSMSSSSLVIRGFEEDKMDNEDESDDDNRKRKKEGESVVSGNGQSNSRNGPRRPSSFLDVHEGTNTRKLKGASSSTKSISHSQIEDDDEDIPSPVYVDDDKPWTSFLTKRSSSQEFHGGGGDGSQSDFDIMNDKDDFFPDQKGDTFRDNLADDTEAVPSLTDQSLSPSSPFSLSLSSSILLEEKVRRRREEPFDSFRSIKDNHNRHPSSRNDGRHQMDQSVFDSKSFGGSNGESDEVAAASLHAATAGGASKFLREDDIDDDYSSVGEKNRFDDVVSQIIAEDRVKEDEYDNEEYEEIDDLDEESGNKGSHNLIIKSTKTDLTNFERIVNPPVTTSSTTTSTTTSYPSTMTTPTTQKPMRSHNINHLSIGSMSGSSGSVSVSSGQSSSGSGSNSNSLSNNHNNLRNSANSNQLTYKVEYYSANEVKSEWLLGATDVPVETFTLKYLKPNTEYIFFVRSVSPEGIVSAPSPLSESVTTALSGTRSTELAQAREKLGSGIIVILKNVYPTSSTSIKIEWQIVSAADFVEGFYIYYRRLEQNSNPNDGSYQMLTVLNAGASTFQIVGLDKFATYQIFLLPFYKNVEGRPSNYVNVTTLQDVPTAAPELIDPVPVNNSAIVIRWKPPPAAYHNGIILGYQLRVWQGSALVGNKTVDGATSSVVLNNLSPGQSYSLQIGSFTAKGVGIFSSMRTLHFRPDPLFNNNQMNNAINPYNPDSISSNNKNPGGFENKGGILDGNLSNNEKSGGKIVYEEGTNNNINFGPSQDIGGSLEDNLIKNNNNNDFVTSNGIAFGGTTAGRHDVFTEAWFIALIGSVIFAMMLVFIFALYLRRCQIRTDSDKLKVSTTEIPDGSIPPHYPDDNLWIESSQQKQLSLKSVKTNEMNEYENANNYAVVEERHSPIAYATTTLVNGEKHKSSFSVFGESKGMNGHGQRDYSMLAPSPKIVGWANASAGVPLNNKTGSLNICSQDMKKPPWLLPSTNSNPCSSQSSSSHSSASSDALMKLNLKPKLKLKSNCDSNKSRKLNRRPSSRSKGTDVDYYREEGIDEDESFCLNDSQELGKGGSLNVLTTFQTPLPSRKHLIVDFGNGQSVTSSVMQPPRLNGSDSRGSSNYSYGHPQHPPPSLLHSHNHTHNNNHNGF